MAASETAIKAKQTRLATCERKIQEYQDEIETINRSLLKMQDKGFCVYMAFTEGKCVYVGEGMLDRWKHCISGASSCSDLNKDFFLGKPMEVYVIKEGISKEDAIKLEDEIIFNVRPPYNRRVPKPEGITEYLATEFFWMCHGAYLAATANIDDPNLPCKYHDMRRERMRKLTEEC